MLHREILNKEQVRLLPLIRSFKKDFGLVGGTAIALQIGHRQSVDFDLFTTAAEFDTLAVRKKIRRAYTIDRVVTDASGHYTVIVLGVRITFFLYPFPIAFSERFQNLIQMPDLLTLAAMKAYALGRRPKWRDYVDLYFMIKLRHGIGDIVRKAEQIFGKEFNEKLFRVQLCYFDDIDYSEPVIFMEGCAVADEEIRKALTAASLA